MTDLAVNETALRRETIIGLACAVLVVLLWAGFIVLARVGATTSFGPADLAALRFAVAGTLMAPLLARHGFGGLNVFKVVVLTLTAGLGFAFFAFLGLSLVPAPHGAMMPGILPLFTGLLAAALIGERLTRHRLTGMLIIAFGVAVVAVDSGVASSAAPDQWRGDLLLLGAPFCWALYTISIRVWRVAPLQATRIVTVLSAIIYLPVYLIFLDHRLFEAPLSAIAFHGIFQGVFATIISLLAYTRAVKALGAGRTALITAATPAVAAALAIPVAGEIPSVITAAGLGLITLGMISGVVAFRR
jgi:drug/metabolite transporter (DMT)-like permease